MMDEEITTEEAYHCFRIVENICKDACELSNKKKFDEMPKDYRYTMFAVVECSLTLAMEQSEDVENDIDYILRGFRKYKEHNKI